MPHRGGQDHYNATSPWLAVRIRAPGERHQPTCPGSGRRRMRRAAGAAGYRGAEGRAGAASVVGRGGRGKTALTRLRGGAFVKKVS